MVCEYNLLKSVNSRICILAVLAPLVFAAWGCGRSSAIVGDYKETKIQLDFLNQAVDVKYFSSNTDDTTRVNVRYCQLSDTLHPAFRAINQTLLALVIGNIQSATPREEELVQQSSDVKTAVDEFITAYKKSVDEGFPLAWDLWADCSFEGTLDSLVQMSIGVESFTGGAHPFRWSDFHLYSLRTGKEIYPYDFLRDTITMRKLLVQKVRNALGDGEKNLSEIGIYEEYAYGFPITKNIAITHAGATLLYNNYEIAPYYIGPIEIKLTPEETKKFFDMRALRRK
jgi:hypothetical protein